MKKDTINIGKKITDWEKIFELCTMDKELQSVLAIWRFHVCECTCLLIFISNPQIHTSGASVAFPAMHREVNILTHLTHAFPAEAKRGYIPPSCFNTHTVRESFWKSI